MKPTLPIKPDDGHINYITYRKMAEKKPSKMRNVRTFANGRLCDSAKEAQHELLLADMKKNGEIIDYFPQVDFIIQDGYYKGLEWVRPIYYRADFVVIKWPEESAKVGVDFEIHEVKGRWIQSAIDKRKMFESRYPEYEMVII